MRKYGFVLLPVIVQRLDIAKAGEGDYIAHRPELGVNPEQPNCEQLLELAHQFIAQSASTAQCPSRYPRFELHPSRFFPVSFSVNSKLPWRRRLVNRIAPVSNSQDQGLPTTRCAAFIINLLILVGLSVSPSLWPSPSLVQASAARNAERRKALRRLIRWNPVSPLNESSLVANLIPTRSR